MSDVPEPFRSLAGTSSLFNGPYFFLAFCELIENMRSQKTGCSKTTTFALKIQNGVNLRNGAYLHNIDVAGPGVDISGYGLKNSKVRGNVTLLRTDSKNIYVNFTMEVTDSFGKKCDAKTVAPYAYGAVERSILLA